MGFVQVMRRLKAIVPLTIVLAFNSAGIAQSEELSLDELYKLCSSFPFNSRCEGFEAPIPLDQRDGAQVSCGFDLSQVDASGNCRVLLEDPTTLVVYAEEGDPIEPLDNQKGSREIRIPFEQIFSTALRIWEREADATSFLIGGSLYIQRNEVEYTGFERDYMPGDGDEREGRGKKDFAEVVIDFVEAPENNGHRSNILRITATEEFGAYLLEQLETGDVSTTTTILTTSNQTVENPRQQLLDTNSCIRCDLSGVDLSGLDLEKANLEGARLVGANLAGADFSEAYLVGADLSGADLTETDLSRAKLGLANLTGAVLNAVDLHAASLPLANLQDATMVEADLGGVHLAGANLTNVNLSEADLTEFTSTGFIPFLGLQRFRLYANLRGADLSGSVLTMADFDDAVLAGAKLVEVNLDGANLNDVALQGADLTGATVSEEELASARLCGAIMPNGEISTVGCEEN